jgi:hypothetical protein
MNILAKAVEHANERLAKEGIEPPPHLTPHGLRRTYASLLFALGESPVYAMNQLRHTDPTITLAFYAKAMLRRDGEEGRLKALVGGEFRQDLGRESEIREPEPVVATPQTRLESGVKGP